jgi:hypothetical protein
MTKIAAWANIDLTFSHASKTILDLVEASERQTANRSLKGM